MVHEAWAGLQSAQEMAAAAAAAAVVREAAASAVMDVLEGESEEEKSAKLAAAKEEKMRTVIRCANLTCLGGHIHSVDILVLLWLTDWTRKSRKRRCAPSSNCVQLTEAS